MTRTQRTPISGASGQLGAVGDPARWKLRKHGPDLVPAKRRPTGLFRCRVFAGPRRGLEGRDVRQILANPVLASGHGGGVENLRVIYTAVWGFSSL